MGRSVFFAALLLLCVFTIGVNCKHGEESTCEVLRDIDNIYGDIANSSMAVCTTNGEKDCDTLICNALLGATQISHNVTILPCNDPPGIRYRQAVGGQLIINRVFTKTENYTVPGNLGTVEVTVDQLEEEIGIRLRSIQPVLFVFLEYTEVPVECKGAGAGAGAGVRGEILLVAILSAAIMLMQLL